MVEKIIKRKGRCYLLIKCPQQGSTGPGDTSEEENDDTDDDKMPTPPDYEDETEEDISREKGGYSRQVGRPAIVDVPSANSNTVVNRVSKQTVVSEEADTRLPEVGAELQLLEMPVAEVQIYPSSWGSEVNPTSVLNPKSEIAVRYQPRLTENLSADMLSSGAHLLDGIVGEANTTYMDIDAAVHSGGGPGVKYVDTRTGLTGDSVSPERVLPQTFNRLSRPIAKANAAMLAVDAANALWDGYEYGAFDTVEGAVDYISQVVQAIPEGVVKMGEDAFNAVVNDQPEVLVDVATNVIGVPSALKLFDRVASTVTGEDIDIGAQTMNAIIDHAPKSVWIQPENLGFGPKLGSVSNDGWKWW